MDAVRVRSQLARVGTTGAIVVVLGLALAVEWLTPLDLFVSANLAVAAVAVVALVLFPRTRAALVRRTGASLAAWAAAGLVFVVGVALTYALGSPEPFCDRPFPRHRGCLTTYGIGSTLFLAGAVAGAVALGHARRFRRLAGTPVTGAGTVDPGHRAVVGRVVPVGEPRRTPAGAEAVWYRYEVRVDGDEGWRTVAAGTDSVRFYVEDGSGRLLVVPRAVDEFLATMDATTATTTLEAGEPLAGDLDVPADRTRQVREWRIEPDDVLFVSGRVGTVSPAEYPARTAVGVDGEVGLAAASRDEVVGTVRWRVLAGSTLAVLVGGAGYVTMLLAL